MNDRIRTPIVAGAFYPSSPAELERSIEVGSEKNVNREVRFYLGTIYETMGQFKKARAAYEAYIQRFPGSKAARAARPTSTSTAGITPRRTPWKMLPAM